MTKKALRGMGPGMGSSFDDSSLFVGLSAPSGHYSGYFAFELEANAQAFVTHGSYGAASREEQ